MDNRISPSCGAEIGVGGLLFKSDQAKGNEGYIVAVLRSRNPACLWWRDLERSACVSETALQRQAGELMLDTSHDEVNCHRGDNESHQTCCNVDARVAQQPLDR